LLIPFNSLSFEELDAFILGVLIAFMTLIFSVGNLIGWIMPRKLKNYFNRNYKPIEEETFSEIELMKIIRKELSKGGK